MLNKASVCLPTHQILLVDDHAFTRTGLRAILSTQERCCVVGEARHGAQAIDLMASLQPTVVLMDVGMPVMDGITATQILRKQFSSIAVIMLTSHTDSTEVWAALSAGAQGYCLKDIPITRLMQVMDTVADGATWLDPGVAHVLLNPASKPQVLEVDERLALMTDREREVLQLIVDGLSNQDMAERLQVTLHTVKAHVGNIIQKLSVSDRTQAAVLALRKGWLR